MHLPQLLPLLRLGLLPEAFQKSRPAAIDIAAHRSACVGAHLLEFSVLQFDARRAGAVGNEPLLPAKARGFTADGRSATFIRGPGNDTHGTSPGSIPNINLPIPGIHRWNWGGSWGKFLCQFR
jgi:hypothetical protein